MLLFQDQTPSSSSPLVENNPTAETKEGGTQALSEEAQEKLKEIFFLAAERCSRSNQRS
jgi:hypothetical protein